MKDMNNLDQFYTKDNIAIKCTNILMDNIPNLEIGRNVVFLEPSAGEGAFIKSLLKKGVPENKIISVDIEPKYNKTIKKDYLLTDANFFNIVSKSDCITIGNPPFGKRSKLAIDFFNHAATMSDTIAFIVPLQFQKWSVHSKLNQSFSLIYSEPLPEDSFTFNNKDYKVRCAFQIWTRLKNDYMDLRVKKAPATQHSDFEMWQYNNTKNTEKYFTDYEWDFCVPRQGFYDYDLRIKDHSLCSRKRQWIFFKAKNKEVLELLFNIDYWKLAKKNTMIYGFGKADVVEEYEKIRGELYGKPK